MPRSRESRTQAVAARVSIVGASGSGKSFLAAALARSFGLPCYELDQLRWRAGGDAVPEAEFIDHVERIIARDRWIVDGHYRNVRHLIWRRSAMIVWLDYPWPLVASQVLARFVRKKRTGPERKAAEATFPVLPGLPIANATWSQRLSRLARTVGERTEYRRLLLGGQYDPAQVVRLTSRRATREWLQTMDRN